MFQVMPDSPIPVICDRCRAEGLAGEDPFEAFGALLDFEPVPRSAKRADGWDAEVQRAYIAALSLTGTDRAACRAVGKSAFGVTQLIRHEGSESFRAAREEALAMAADERSRRLAEGLRAVAADQSGWRPPEPPWSGAASRRPPPAAVADLEPALEPAGTDSVDADKLIEELLSILARKYFSKLEQERQARLQGRIAEADFYVRQITCLEVSLDMVSGDGMAYLRDFRCRGHDLLHIAETEMSRLLDQARRIHWERCGEPPRPDHPPLHLLVQQEGFAIEPLDATSSGHPDGLTHAEQYRLHQERNARDAEAQIAWEAQAREAAAEWRARLDAQEDPSPLRGEGKAPPGAEGEGASTGPPPAEDPDEEPKP
jgi:hypothetical protein